MGLDASDAELGVRAQNTWVLRDYDADAAIDHFEVCAYVHMQREHVEGELEGGLEGG